jgi:hypothetical protein
VRLERPSLYKIRSDSFLRVKYRTTDGADNLIEASLCSGPSVKFIVCPLGCRFATPIAMTSAWPNKAVSPRGGPDKG